MAYTTINKPNQYFNPVIYTGDGTTNQTKTITFGFQPDWAWFKSRDAANSHILVDSVRGGTKYLVSETTNAEATLGVAQLFTSTGMIISNDAGANSINSSGSAKVCWGWLASNTTVSNTSGSITSTVSANTTSGFSIVSYTGDGVNNRTVGHGLGATPKFIIIKNRSAGVAFWSVINSRSTSTTNTNILYLNRADAEADDTNIMGTNLPNSTTFGIGNYAGVNVNNENFIAYCFAEIKGYSKFGSYTGNANSNGPFVYTGFKPAFVLLKSSSAAYNWHILDAGRNTSNVIGADLTPNTSSGETTDTILDFVSNGFKFRRGDAGWNDANTYIYAAFAQNPFVSSTKIPTTAR